MLDTYLVANIKDVGLIRWEYTGLPLHVYIAPFHWYQKEKQDKAKHYEQMIWQGFELWSQLSGGVVTFHRVGTLQDSQINVVWRRVDRKSLGHCEYTWDPKGRIYSAEISIGLSDGRVHHYYDNPEEVKRTILHEIGHALGLGHSNHIRDIMYPTHQIGVNQISMRDVETLRWLYKLPTGFDYLSEAQRLGLPMESRIDEVVEALYLRPSYSATSPSGQAQCFSNVLENAQTAAKGLDIQAQQDVLTQKGRYLMATSLIQVEPLQLPEPSAKKASEKPKKQAPLWIPPPTHS
jgi:hypothetical protein